jgi:putative two-component system response regulator
LSTAGYDVRVARDGQEALDLVHLQPPDLVLTDLDMPNMDGYALCQQIKRDPATHLIPVVIVTGRDTCDDKIRAWDLGADEFLTKPFRAIEVLARCRSLLRLKRLVDQLDSAEAVVFAFARTVEAKCRYTWGHSERVTDYALTLARRLALSDEECETLRKGGLLHDIGKICVPDAVLNKPGKLTEDEYATIKEHPVQGVRIIEPLQSVRTAIPLVRWHHERLDGRGYPDGIFGGAIPLLARILAVADVYDALSSERPYRPALPHEECLRILRENALGGGVDPELVHAFCARSTAPALCALESC